MLYQMVINHSGYTIIHTSKLIKTMYKKKPLNTIDKDLKIIKSEGKKKNHIL